MIADSNLQLIFYAWIKSWAIDLLSFWWTHCDDVELFNFSKIEHFRDGTDSTCTSSLWLSVWNNNFFCQEWFYKGCCSQTLQKTWTMISLLELVLETVICFVFFFCYTVYCTVCVELIGFLHTPRCVWYSTRYWLWNPVVPDIIHYMVCPWHLWTGSSKTWPSDWIQHGMLQQSNDGNWKLFGCLVCQSTLDIF